MQATIDKLNIILARWDPIGVGATVAKDEYKGYIPLLLKHISNKQLLMSCLEDILVNKLECEYNSKNKKHVEDLQNICDQIMEACKLEE